VKIAWPSPRFIVAKHIEQVFLLADLLKLLDSLNPWEDGIGVIGVAGERRAASENLSDGGGETSSSPTVLGT
jgi:hypothetical protein